MGEGMRLLITGGCGFIGSNFLRYILSAHPEYVIINLDALTYAGNLNSVKDISSYPNYTFIHGDITDFDLVSELMGRVDAVINFAAETHVDRSIIGPSIFVKTNVLGTQVLLDVAKIRKVQRFLQISTDEVYGSLWPEGRFTEESPLRPNSPYSASKAAADHLVMAYNHTYGLPALVCRPSNNFGHYQYPEKLIPLFIMKAMGDEQVPLYGDGLNVRDWIYVEDCCRAIYLVFEKGKDGEIYNIGGGNEKTNIEITRLILKVLNKPEGLINYVPDRPGHDRRYALDSNKIKKELGWRAIHDFDEAIRKTIDWYKENQDWCKKVLEKGGNRWRGNG
jgi:dTDP-glucose 4,6-dehydratase